MEKHFPRKRSFIKSLGHERDRENKIISCSTYYDGRQKTFARITSCSAFAYLLMPLQIVRKRMKRKKRNLCPRFRNYAYQDVLAHDCIVPR